MLFGASTFIWVSPFSNDNLWLVNKVKQFGFDIIEVCIENPSVVDPGKVREELDKVGIGVILCGAFGPNRDISSDDQKIQSEGIDYLKICIDYAEIIGSPTVIGPMYSATGKTRLLSEEEKKKQWDLAVRNLKFIAEYAEGKGIKLAIEPLNRFETDLINTVDQGIELVTQIGYKNVGLLLDTFHMNIEEKDTARAIERAGEKVFHFHSCSNDRGTPGEGQINWQKISTALKKIRYRGPVVIESFTPEIKEIARAVSLWRPIAKDQDSLANDGLVFLKKVLGY
jgi:D-psicose/D-tagatose/L-ribulose 3-epimerase